MRWIPKVLAGTCVVVAAALTAVPVTAGLADLVLGPGPNSTKRNAQPALTSMRTPGPPVTGRTEESATASDPVSTDGHEVIEGTIVDDSSPVGALSSGSLSTGTELVAATVADARTRIADLAADLQSGVSAGEFTQADADRVVADMAGYIHGTRTWPERLTP
ncbi:hypothetical protein QYM46_12480 [Brevibacterium sp. K11IcPPYGO002]|uniref:hypothetical protein n=1 Tax=Brevibacterium sp. K11IcPPYGO002 TaxID=3058837 RepID=UPI003D818C20